VSTQPRLTTTSYAVLCLLGVQPWSTYELTRQMDRSLGRIWPRATSKLYEEPKKLVAHGLATATREYTGRRRRTVYAITDDGRKALRRWLDEPGQPPLVEFEGVLKVLFAEQGTKQQLLATLRSIREQAQRTRDEHAALADDLSRTGGPFPDRLHVNELVFRFMWEQTDTVIRWATWAEQQVADWPEDITRPDRTRSGTVLRQAASER